MKRLLSLMLIFVSVVGIAYAQVETNYYQSGEVSHNPWQSAHRDMNVRRMPSFDLAQLQREDAIRDTTRALFRFGKGFDVNYTLADGQWECVEGGRLWTMTLVSGNALSLNFVFNDFHLPKGAELYIENEDQTVLYGPVTSEAISDNGIFLTDIIPGEQATICLYEPWESEGLSTLTIKRVVHGYRTYANDPEAKTPICDRLFDSNSVACYPEYELQSDAVAMVLSSSGDGICSGALVMSTDYSFKGYFLTTFDLIDTDGNGTLSNAEKTAAESCMFKFRYKEKYCGSNVMETSYTYNQSTFRSAWNITKFALMEIGGNISQNKKLTWLGWDRSGASPTSGVCIQHQYLQDMVLSVGDNSGFVLPYSGTISWKAFFVYGGVSQGSRGAPLLDQNKRVVAHEFGENIYGGVTSSQTGYFGKFSESWLGNYTSSTRLKSWLDPINTNQTTINSSRTMTIKGPNKIISSSSYYVENLPSGMTVVWTISDSYYHANCLQQNTPSANRCTVTRDPSHSLTNALLKAYIRKNGSVNIIQKIISTGDGFDGTYYNGQSTVQVDLPSPLYVLPGALVTITSQDLVGATATQNGGNTTPTSWSFNPYSGILKVGMPSSSGMAVVVRVVTSGGVTYTLPITTTSDTGYLMSVSPVGNYLEVSVFSQDNRDNDDRSVAGEQTWTLESYNATTGEKVFGMSVEGTDYSINTTGWKPGVYVVRAIIGNDVLSEKVAVK